MEREENIIETKRGKRGRIGSRERETEQDGGQKEMRDRKQKVKGEKRKTVH